MRLRVACAQERLADWTNFCDATGAGRNPSATWPYSVHTRASITGELTMVRVSMVRASKSGMQIINGKVERRRRPVRKNVEGKNAGPNAALFKNAGELLCALQATSAKNCQ